MRIGPLEIPGNIFLAPVAGYSDRAFRSVCVDLGADFTCTELVSSEALVRDSAKTAVLLRRAENETRYAIQLFGSDPVIMERAARSLAPWKPEVLDLNCGCPVPKVVKTGAGSALMRESGRFALIMEALVRASREELGGIPVTVKIRSGWDENSINYREIARIAVESGAALVALHARTRSQGYGGKADWDKIADLASRLTVPVIGSGDLYSAEDAHRMLGDTACAGVMFARGAMGNPFVFAETKQLLTKGSYESTPISVRLATGFRQLGLLVADIGEDAACKEMRKQFCAYTKGRAGEPGIPGAAALRNRLVHAQSVAEYREILLASSPAEV